MAVKKKAGRPRKSATAKGTVKKAVEKVEMKVDQPVESQEIKDSEVKAEEPKELKGDEMFPDREPVYGGDIEYESDSTQLTRNGQPWVPEEHGYVARLISPEAAKYLGMRGYVPVPVESGIRFKDHPLNTDIFDGEAGKAVYRHPKDTPVINDEIAELTGGRSKYVKMNSSFLCLIPAEKAHARRKHASEISNGMVKSQLQHADQEAQEEQGSNVRRVGVFRLGRTASRAIVNNQTKSVRKIWSVPKKIS